MTKPEKIHKVVGLGVATLDYRVSLDEFPLPDVKLTTDRWNVTSGGNCANTLSVLARRGVESHIITALGDDAVGRQTRDFLESAGIHTDNVNVLGTDSSFSFIIVAKDQMTRCILHRPGPSYSSMLSFDRDVVEGAGAVYADGRFAGSALMLASIAAYRKVPVFVEAEREGLDVDKIFPYAHTVFVSRAYHEQHFRSDDYEMNLDRILQQGPEIAVTTLGDAGAMMRSDGRTIACSAVKADIVDTTGAGDAFNAGFIKGYLDGLEGKDLLEYASKVAAEECSRKR